MCMVITILDTALSFGAMWRSIERTRANKDTVTAQVTNSFDILFLCSIDCTDSHVRRRGVESRGFCLVLFCCVLLPTHVQKNDETTTFDFNESKLTNM